jgi:mRNA interferase MazF
MVDLSPTRGREQAGMRPALVLSVDKFNHGPADLVIVLPITKTQRGIPTHVLIPVGEAGLTIDSYIKCEDIRSISKDRLVRYMGAVTTSRIERVQKWVRVLLGL